MGEEGQPSADEERAVGRRLGHGGDLVVVALPLREVEREALQGLKASERQLLKTLLRRVLESPGLRD